MKRTLSTALLAGMVVFAAACGDDDMTDPTPDPGTAEIRVIHASPDAPAVDIYVAGSATPVITDLAYGDSSNYLSVDEGSYDFQIRAAGADASSEPVYSTGALALADGDRVTAIASGLLAGTGDQAFRVLALPEAFAMPAADSAIVRIVHGSADAPTVAIDVGNDGTPEVAALDRYADTGAAGVELPAGEALQIGIWAGDPLERVTAFTTPELPAGAELFVIATGLVGELPSADDGFGLLAVGPDGAIGIIQQNPSVFALHASPDAPAVDIYAGSAELTSNLAFGDLSPAMQVPPGAYSLDFYATGTGPGTPAASADTPTLAAGQRYLAIASGFLLRTDGSEPFQLLAFADAFGPTDGTARARIIHASPDAPAVDISTVTGGEMDTPSVVDGAAFTQESGAAGIALPVADLTVGVAGDGSINPLVTFDLSLVADLRAFVVAAGALAPGQDEEGFRLLLVDASSYPWAVAEVMPNQ
jgi:hypothetical protein